MRRRVDLTARARRDLVNIYAESFECFGRNARERYEALFAAAFRDLADDPARPSVQSSGGALCAYHLRHSRARLGPNAKVRKPRHLLIFTVETERIAILRILHDLDGHRRAHLAR